MLLLSIRWPELVWALVGVSIAPDFLLHLWDGMSNTDKHAVESMGYYKMLSPYGVALYKLTLQLFKDAQQYRVMTEDGVKLVKCPVTILHGEEDEVVSPSVAQSLASLLHHTLVQLKVIEKGDHRLSRDSDLEEIVNALDSFLQATTPV
jgi:pimeloyl-ACP methyl ester carboxylesterase